MSKSIELKKCARCGELKNVADFNRHYEYYQPYCKVCQTEYTKERDANRKKDKDQEIVFKLGNSKIVIIKDTTSLFLYDMQVYQDDLDNLQKLIDYSKVH